MTAVFDFGAFPPEVNSGKMYAGPGSASMLAAASAWNGLAAELRSQAANYSTAITNLAGDGWRGPASAAMVTAAAPYAAWMNTTAAQAEQTGNQLLAAASAYEAAFAMTVPPPVIAANRIRLASLVATNLLGQNTPAIAATEAQYGQMWAQDAAAMYGYSAQAAAATTVQPFTAAPQTTTAGALPVQAAAVTAATGTPAGAGTQAALSQVSSTVPTALQSLAAPAATASSSSSASGLSGILNLLMGGSSGNSALDSFWSQWGPDANIWNTIFSSGFYMPSNTLGAFTSLFGSGGGAASAAGEALGQAATGGLAAPLGGLSGQLGGLGALGPGAVGASAALGQATPIGPLSVPPTWAAPTPPASPIAAALGDTPLAAPPAITEGVPGLVPPAIGAREGAGAAVLDGRYLAHPPMVPSWAAVG
jgi:PPE-repeat protein